MPKAKTAKIKRQEKWRSEYAKKEIQRGNRSPKFEEQGGRQCKEEYTLKDSRIRNQRG
jgi:hypothetical protein